MGGGFWSIILIVGPIVLLGVIVWAWLSNRSAPKSTVDRAERGARELREEIEHEQVPPPGS